MALLRLFAENLLPVLLAASAGYALAAALKTDPRGLTSVGFNLFAPCLVFQVILESQVPVGEMLRMLGFAAASLFLPAGVALAIARWRRWPRTLSSAVVLCVLLPNVGNYGMSTNLLAFGKEGLTYASLYFLAASILTYTVGVFVASLGRASARTALQGLGRVPAIWAMALALIMRSQQWMLPSPAARAVELLAQACIPTFLVILGMQLHGARLQRPSPPLLVATSLRLVGGVLAGFALAPLFGLEGVPLKAGVLQSAMPSAVITIILATEYDVEPVFVTAVVLLTTLLSPLTLTGLLALLT
jgi:predicted permease